MYKLPDQSSKTSRQLKFYPGCPRSSKIKSQCLFLSLSLPTPRMISSLLHGACRIPSLETMRLIHLSLMSRRCRVSSRCRIPTSTRFVRSASAVKPRLALPVPTVVMSICGSSMFMRSGYGLEIDNGFMGWRI